MKLTRTLAATTLIGVLVAFPAVGAQAGAGTGEVTIAQMATYAPDEDFPLTICIDDEIVDNGVGVAAGTVLDPITVTVGTHTIEFFQGDTCEGDPFVGTEFDVMAGDDMTLMSWWGDLAEGVAVFDNDTSCVPTGQSRLTIRNAGNAEPVDFLLTPEGGDEEAIASDLDSGEEGAAEVPAGFYSDGRFINSVTETQVIALGPNELVDGENGVVYLYAGADAVEGAETYEYISFDDPCEVPTTSSSTTTSTSTTTTQAVAAVTTPRFTG